MANKVISILLAATGVTPTLSALEKVAKAVKELRKSDRAEGLEEIFKGFKGQGAAESVVDVAKAFTGLANAMADVRGGVKTTKQAIADAVKEVPLLAAGYNLAEAVDRLRNPEKYRDADVLADVAKRRTDSNKSAQDVIKEMRQGLKDRQNQKEYSELTEFDKRRAQVNREFDKELEPLKKVNTGADLDLIKQALDLERQINDERKKKIAEIDREEADARVSNKAMLYAKLARVAEFGEAKLAELAKKNAENQRKAEEEVADARIGQLEARGQAGDPIAEREAQRLRILQEQKKEEEALAKIANNRLLAYDVREQARRGLASLPETVRQRLAALDRSTPSGGRFSAVDAGNLTGAGAAAAERSQAQVRYAQDTAANTRRTADEIGGFVKMFREFFGLAGGTN